MKCFVDTDVILDVLLDRQDFPESKTLLKLLERNSAVLGYTSAIVLLNTYYLGVKALNKLSARKAIQKLRLIFSVLPVSQKHVDQALASDFTDFEDGVQYYAAIEAKIDFIITRNKKDYQESKIPVLSPAEFLSMSEELQSK